MVLVYRRKIKLSCGNLLNGYGKKSNKKERRLPET